jgi:transmembrane sensor
MPIEIDYETCLRYVRGQSSLEEARAVRAWLADPANELLAHYWMGQHAQEPELARKSDDNDPYDYASMRENIYARMQVEPALAVNPPRPSTWRRWAAAAAVVGAVASTGWLLHERNQVVAPTVASYTTPYGRTQIVRLPDGSEVTLNAHSTVRYVATPDPQRPREVWLDGEAYFSVKHLPDNKPFVVHTTAGFAVEVLGTKFTVYRRHEEARVVLLSGKVQVAFADSTRRKVILKPGELLQTSDKEPKKVVHQAVQTASYAAWTDDKMVFDATSIADIATRLQDTYGVEVEVASPDLKKRKFTGTFPIDNLDLLCENLAATFHLQIVHRQNRLILSNYPSSHHTP